MKKIICLMLAMLVMMSCALPVFADTTIPGAGTEINNTPQKKWNAFFTYEDFRFNKLAVNDLIAWYHNNAKTSAPYDQCNYLLTCKISQKYGSAQMDDSYEIFVFPKSVSSLTFDSENMCFELPVGTEYYSATFFSRSYIEKADFDIKNSNSFKVTTTNNKNTFFPAQYSDQRVLLLRNDFDIIDKETGKSLDSEISGQDPFTFGMDNDGERTVKFTVSTTLSNEYLMHLKIYNQDSNHAEESQHIPYGDADNYLYKFSKTQQGFYPLNVTHFKDSCSDKKTYSDKIIVNVWVTDLNSEEKIAEEFFFADLKTIFDEVENSDSLFSQKKDYENFPSIEDYIDTDFPDIRDYVNFDMFNDADSIADYIIAIFQFLWSCLTGFFRWLWAALKFIFINFVGLFKWLGACLWTIIKNIGIALYNLVVDIRRLLIYLFVPDSTKLQNLIKDKFPALLKIEGSIKAGQNSNSNTSINLFGRSFDFDFSDMPDSIKSFMYTGSTIFLYATQVFMIVKMVMKFFGVSAGGEEE